MRSQLGMTCQSGYGPRPPAFIGNFKFSGTINCEWWDQIEAECCRVIVVDEENDVGRMILHPLFGKLVTAKYLLPVRLFFSSGIPRGADGGNVRRVDGGGNPGHGQP